MRVFVLQAPDVWGSGAVGSWLRSCRNCYTSMHFATLPFCWMEESFPKVIRFSVHLPPDLTVGCGGEAAVEGERSKETRAEPGRIP